MQCVQNECMTNIQIRDIPDDVHEALVRKAHDARQSLQQYMRALAIREARQPSMAELLAQAKENARRFGGSYSFDEVVEDLREAREGRPIV